MLETLLGLLFELCKFAFTVSVLAVILSGAAMGLTRGQLHIANIAFGGSITVLVISLCGMILIAATTP